MTQYIVVYVKYYIFKSTKTGKCILRILAYTYFLVHISHTSLIRYNKLALLYIYIYI